MDRTEFEHLRDLPSKTIKQDISFSSGQQITPLQRAEGIKIDNAAGVDLVMSITYNPEVGSTSINVHVPGTGPICRLDIDGAPHGVLGRCHKHSLESEHCSRQNLRKDVGRRSDLTGLSVQEIFEAFCRMANIDHIGLFTAPPP